MLTLDYVKGKSAARLKNLHPLVAEAAEVLIDRCYSIGIYVLITQGLRTYAEQNALYAQGRTKPGIIVTNAKGGESNHNFGVAIDFALFLPNGKDVTWDTLKDGNLDYLPDWSQVVDEAKQIGFTWGGDWKSFKDLPHLEMLFGLTTAQYRAGQRPTSGVLAAVQNKINARKVALTLKKDDANAIINKFLKPAYAVAETTTQRKEVGRLADELRVASGQPKQNS
ncbi:M15 family peptidase [Paenibacillus anaericanus]|uniref:M15 family peptidase n=1 Tax=Paenibacillus anaericanus TaxID=170367 RepID=A0A433YFD4_9BACL|nr:M15 family metallopeptidase [Paenibacillus anaericanus]RUT48589.1 M15 family peptidase [Paenibacillus anaericanus]